ncbi:MAG: hypothetical protein KGJ97_05680 [Xanthomonadaceae bacterium]|jgi:hypothetical protein|nr:hypothetical protein [Xanthomonadaceae bacterium]MDE3072225.1 hypothetical protein [Pseudomonadota bacterium]
MKAQKLIASVAAILFTTASLSAVNYNVDVHQAAATRIDGRNVTDLAPIQVRPSADDLRAAALLPDARTASIASIPALDRAAAGSGGRRFALISSQLVMPYYSFGNKFGRITKE